MYILRLLYVQLILKFIERNGSQEKNPYKYILYGILSNMKQSAKVLSASCEKVISYYSSLVHYVTESIFVDILKDEKRSDELYYRIATLQGRRTSCLIKEYMKVVAAYEQNEFGNEESVDVQISIYFNKKVLENTQHQYALRHSYHLCLFM
ncbi:hypothetical protein C922_05408 [Plasmodium inui San Antonio 1]|uniref:Uncharacterized protein n=1 Tax=Plasmodium inui San Antonio 1 TaxID=1237626 RepID=W6ZY45_9APIC|nr:hypothetical protein C922_05408 [Plasmodium inui San Antonio 1]EUD64210.1 hypothetical protein C922_05408 [Plasmodium inui San Antonio 1]